MSEGPGQRRVSASGGLHELFSMVLGGLVGTTPHMISASVMALARLLYEFAGALEGVVPQLLPAVLMLLRSKALEVVKSVLGFLKVGRSGCPPWQAGQPPVSSPLSATCPSLLGSLAP
jgi:ribosomal RNA-processing protein 12